MCFSKLMLLLLILFTCYIVGARFSFAVKMAASKEIALRKSDMMDLQVLRDALNTLQGDEAEKLINIILEIEAGKMDRETIQEVVAEYEARLEVLSKQLGQQEDQ